MFHAVMDYEDSGSIKVTTRRNSVEILITLPNSMKSGPIGGYDCTPIEGSLANKYTCIICKLVQREPTIVSCCGQHFCKSCLYRSFLGRLQICPHCRARDIQYFTNKQQEREVECLRVRCPNHEIGCLWTGEVRGLEEHVDTSSCIVTGQMRGKEEETSDEESIAHSLVR